MGIILSLGVKIIQYYSTNTVACISIYPLERSTFYGVEYSGIEMDLIFKIEPCVCDGVCGAVCRGLCVCVCVWESPAAVVAHLPQSVFVLRCFSGHHGCKG